jgi:hypothetical protein
MPTQGLLNYLYGRGSHSVIGVGWSESEAPRLTIPEKLVVERELESHSASRSYFELGVGKGLLYQQFLQSGWTCHGVEPGAWGQKFPGVLGNMSDVRDSYTADVIVALDVLEHVSDPVSTLRQLREHAGQNARLYSAMPNRVSLRAKFGRENWRMLRPLGHVNYWSRRSVTKAFTASGFIVEELRKTDLYQSGRVRSLRTAVGAAVEHLGLGDQWMVIARPG